MSDHTLEDLVFETTVSCTLVVVVIAITALLYQLIAVAVSFVDPTVLPHFGL